ncbi:hypothetical protein [Agaribacterium haliotis]|uniref:hypothetical protein n=1 Tax=Agaribacterium haliotis TaxID=2013869 RepID=UPI00117802F6|nr:hypothetical protein [Agaribacterium haliotis]
MNSNLTRYAFYMGMLYFFFMAVAHFFSIKVPLLFVYYDTPFFAYQDKIISFAVCAYIGLFYSASKHRDVALTAIVVMALTVAGLVSVNMSAGLLQLLAPGQTSWAYWLQTAFIGSYLLLLLGLYMRDGKQPG